jgi:riboflavin biosynthesis pyrimidine reductase
MTSSPSINCIDDLDRHLQAVHTAGNHNGRPFTLVSYAQCLDGSIATIDRRPLAISGRASMTLTHRLRALFDGILIGINTLLADDPRLTVRLVDGTNPQPSRTGHPSSHPRCLPALAGKGSRRMAGQCRQPPGGPTGGLNPRRGGLPAVFAGQRGRIDLHALLQKLHDRGVHSLMVEGGAQVITSFIRAGLADLFIITVSPAFVGGLQAVDGRSTAPLSKLSLTDINYERMEDDLIIWAKPGNVKK